MNSPITLKYKKERVRKTIYLTCEYCHLSVPTINFDGCPLEGKNGPEWGHYHTGGVNKICVSERQLMQQSSTDLENTAIHEVIHHMGLMHGSPEEKSKFEKIKNYVKSQIWRPEGSAHFTSAEQVRAADERIRADPARYTAINEDSDYLKFIEGRPTGNRTKEPEKPKELKEEVKSEVQTKAPILHVEKTHNTKIIKEKIGRKVKKTSKKLTKYKPMSKKEIEKSRKKLSITTEKQESKDASYKIFSKINNPPKLSPEELAEIQKAKAKEVEEAKERHERWLKQEKQREKAEREHEERINKAYTDMDTGFGDEHGENRWNRKKKSLFGRLKKALGIDQG